MLTVICACGKVLNVDPGLAGKDIPCPDCGKTLSIPGRPAALIQPPPPTTGRPASRLSRSSPLAGPKPVASRSPSRPPKATPPPAPGPGGTARPRAGAPPARTAPTGTGADTKPLRSATPPAPRETGTKWGLVLLIVGATVLTWGLVGRKSAPTETAPSDTPSPVAEQAPPREPEGVSGPAPEDLQRLRDEVASKEREKAQRDEALEFLASAPAPAQAEGWQPPAVPPQAEEPPPSPSAEGTGEKSLADLVERCQKSVVLVQTDQSVGTGWAVEGGLVVTNLHVVAGARQLWLVANEERAGKAWRIDGVHVIAVHRKADLVLLQLPRNARLPTLALSPSQGLRAGDKVFALGNPGVGGQVLQMTVTEGIVSNACREANGIRYVQTSAPINPGNSGGPLLDMRGDVLGVVTLKVQGAEGLGFAVSSVHVQELIEGRDAEFKLVGELAAAAPDPGTPPPSGGAGSETAEVIELPEGSQVIDVGHRVLSMWLEPSGKRLFAIDYDENSLLVIDVAKGEVSTKVFVGSEPTSMSPSHDKRVLLVPCFGAHDVAVVDVSSAKVTSRIATAEAPVCVTPTEDRNRFFYIAATGRSLQGAAVLCWRDVSAKKDVQIWNGGQLDAMSSSPMAWVPGVDTLVWMLPTSYGSFIFFAHPDRPRPRDGRQLQAYMEKQHREGWEMWQVSLDEANLEGSGVLLDAGNSKGFLTAKRRYSLDTGEPVQKGYFKPAEYPGLRDPRYAEYVKILRMMDNLMAASDDGSLVMSATNVYDAKTYMVKTQLPFPCAVAAIRKDLLCLFDPVSRKIALCPMK